MIKKTNKKNVFSILENKNCTKIRFIFKSSLLDKNQLNDLGFLKIKKNEQIIPNTNLNVFFKNNAENKYKVRKDLPKVKKEIEYDTQITDWHGERHNVSVYKELFVYQKDVIYALKKELYLIEIDNDLYVSTEEIEIKNQEEIKYNLDLILYAYNEVEIINSETHEKLQKIKKVNWEILPSGENPWEKVKEFIREKNTEEVFTKEEKNPIYRAEKIVSYKPNFIALGKESFNNYIVYSFDNIFILESYKKDNATYIFRENWENLSKLTKKELLSLEKSSLERIIHANNWDSEIKSLFD